MRVVAPKGQPGNDRLFDRVELRHQLGEKRLAGFVEKRPPRFFAIFRMHNPHTIWSLFRPIMRDFEGAEHVFLAL